MPKLSGKGGKGSKGHQRMRKVLLWFGRHQFDLLQATKAVVSRYDIDAQNRIEDKIKLSCDLYLDQSTDLTIFFEHDVIQADGVISNSGKIFRMQRMTVLFRVYVRYGLVADGACTRDISVGLSRLSCL